MTAKTRLGLMDTSPRKTIQIHFQENRRIAREIGRKAIRVISGDKKNFPLSPDGGVACFILDDDDNTESGDVFIHAMRARCKHFLAVVLTAGSEMPESLVLDSIRAAEFVVLAVYSRISASKGHSGLDEKLWRMAGKIFDVIKSSKGKSIVISFDSPYLLNRFTDADVRIAAYDRMDDVQRAAAELLTGE